MRKRYEANSGRARESPCRNQFARVLIVSMPHPTFCNGRHCFLEVFKVSLFNETRSHAVIYRADARPCLVAYVLGDFRQMQFLNVVAVSIRLTSFAMLNDNESALFYFNTYLASWSVRL